MIGGVANALAGGYFRRHEQLFAYLPTVTVMLIGRDGKTRFSRRQVGSDDLEREISAINELLQIDDTGSLSSA